MSLIPEDLMPLPTQPWDMRPASMPLDVEECRTAIWRNDGNITKAAKLLKVEPQRLRTFVRGNDRLQREVDEASEQIIDKATEVVRICLDDPDERASMARFVMQSIGRKRGWGNGAGSGVVVNNIGGITISWGDGSNFTSGDDAKVIEGEVSNA